MRKRKSILLFLIMIILLNTYNNETINVSNDDDHYDQFTYESIY